MTALVQLHPLLFGMSWMDPNWLLARFGAELFWISLIIVFVECGLLFPFLPGDTLLFGLGLFIATDQLDLLPGSTFVELLGALVALTVAAFLGNASGYEIGRAAGPALHRHEGRIIKQKYFEQTHAFFGKHGNKALVIGRFVPFVRTFVTVVAGISEMNRARFLLWSFTGAFLWVLTITLLGFFLGASFPSLGKNLDYAVIALLVFSLLPIAWEWRRHRRGPGV